MVNYFYENDFVLENSEELSEWLKLVIVKEGKELGEVNYVFCDDEYLLRINQEYLKHDTYTDIITFNYNLGEQLNAEIYISTERVKENAGIFDVSFEDELHRVMAHGILHLCGYMDDSEKAKSLMRSKENEALNLRKFS